MCRVITFPEPHSEWTHPQLEMPQNDASKMMHPKKKKQAGMVHLGSDCDPVTLLRPHTWRCVLWSRREIAAGSCSERQAACCQQTQHNTAALSFSDGGA